MNYLNTLKQKTMLALLGMGILISIPGKAQVTPQEAIVEMKKGINMGNTLEPPDETGWNNPRAEEYYFDMYKAAGFNTVRIPVRWDNHTDQDLPYGISESWLQRVEEVIDWGLERDLWIIVNAHHDNWIKDNYELPHIRARFDSVWTQVSRRFAGKSEKLLFEVLNEPHGLTKIQNDDMHARILSIIRETNPTRIVIFQGHNWGGADELLTAAIPDDDYLIGSFHTYDPYKFGLLGQGTWGSAGDIQALASKFTKVKEWSDTHQIPVLLGEFGAIRYTKTEGGTRTGDLTHYNSRMKHYQFYVEQSHLKGFCFCAWDDGGDFRILERQQRDWKEVKDILIYGSPLSPAGLNAALHQDTIVRLNWTNRAADSQRILIQRRNAVSDFSTVDTLAPDATTYDDLNLIRARDYYYRLIADSDEGEDAYSRPVTQFLPAYVSKVRSPYLGYHIPIPGTVEAEDFDSGGEGLTFHDTDNKNIAGDYRTDVGVDIYERPGGGFHIGNALPGEWYEYSVDVAESDTFCAVIYTAAPMGGGTFQLRIGEVESPVLSAPNTYSWLDTDTVCVDMVLEKGEQIMRFRVISDPLFNIDKIVIQDTDSSSGISSAISHMQNMPGSMLAFQDPSGNLVIELDEGWNPSRLQIYDIMGKLLFSLEDPQRNIKIPSSELTGGVCVIHAWSQGQHQRQKIMIHHR